MFRFKRTKIHTRTTHHAVAKPVIGSQVETPRFIQDTQAPVLAYEPAKQGEQMADPVIAIDPGAQLRQTEAPAVGIL